MSCEAFTIRPFQQDDQPKVIALWVRCELTRPQNDPGKDIARKLQAQSELFVVGTLGGNVVATCMAGYEGHRGWINYLAVDPQHQRKGYGRAILAHAEAMLLACGCPKINLQVRVGNVQAIRFYEAIGFRQDEVISMGKRLIVDGV